MLIFNTIVLLPMSLLPAAIETWWPIAVLTLAYYALGVIYYADRVVPRMRDWARELSKLLKRRREHSKVAQIMRDRTQQLRQLLKR